ncbi:MFS transporter [Clostridium estertheticum]|uniref:MFS transporter n=1 Tax=Clostridium estertheticum TaxID=238834 RepID=UPI0013E95716|nr:MFS transporter [Clostridium estertheticum]MBZ9685476.1 MFS transporter [Clostridium estertheticum]
MNKLQSSSHRKIPLLDKIGYGSGNFSAGISGQVIGTYLVFYCTAILNIPGSLVGLAVSLSIIWDAITDPLMGYFSDMTKSKLFGRRHQYILIGGIGLGISNYLLWNINSGLSDYLKFAIIFFLILVIKTFSTIYVTPYTALGAELSNDYNERTSIQGIKTIFFLLGLAFVSVFGMFVFFRSTPEFPSGQLNPGSYSSMGIFSSILIIIFALICFYSTKKYIPILSGHAVKGTGNAKLKTLLSAFKEIFLNKSFRHVAFAFMFTNIASALVANTGLHVFTYTFSLSSQQIALIVGIQLFVSILSQPIWALAAKKLDKKPSMILGIILCIISSLLFLILVVMKQHIMGNGFYFIPFAVLAGFGTGGLFTLPFSMIADVIDLDELNTGKRSEGSYYGCLTLFYKLSQSITLLLIGFVLDLVKFDANLPHQTESTVIILGLMLSIGSGLSFIAALVSISGYNLNRSSVENIQKKIAEKLNS